MTFPSPSAMTPIQRPSALPCLRTPLALALSLALAACNTVPIAADERSPLVATVSTESGHYTDRQFVNNQAVPASPESRAAPRSTPRTPDFQQPREIPARQASATGDDVLLNFVDADLQGVVRALARFTGRNFVVDPRVKGQLTLVSEAPVTPELAYDMLLGALRMQGFAVVDVGGVSRVIPEADAKLQGSPVARGSAAAAASGSELITRVFTLRYENAANLLPVLRPMIAPNNPINAYPGNNTLVITDYADNLQRVADVIASIDTPATINTDIVPIRHGLALDVAALASELLETRGGSGGTDATHRISIVADPRTNSILINAGSPARLDLARDLIRRIDNPNTRAGNLHVVYLRNAQATRLAEVLRGALTGQSGSSQTGTTSSSNTRRTTSGSSLSGTTGSNTGTSNSSSTSGTLGSTGGSSSLGQDNNQQSVAFSAGGATIQADPTTNTLIISAPAPLYRSLREVIDQLDQRRAQVLVESLIVEVTADNAAEFGIQWMAGGNNLNGNRSSFVGGSNFGGSGIGTSTSGTSTIDMLGQGLNLGVVRGTINILGNEIINLGVLARALETKGGVNILSTPNLMTLDNEEASIMVGRTVPFTTGRYVTSGDGAAANPFQTVQREDVGLTLRIRPQISEGGTVKLALYQEVSSIDAAASVSTDSLTTRKRALETNVLVDDGQIIVLGGLIEDTVSDSTKSVPLLGDIPLLGNLFRYDSRSRSKTNLMVFLRPHIIRNARDGANVTLDRYNYIRSAQSNLPVQPHWIAPNHGRATLPDLSIDQQSGMLDLRSLSSPAKDALSGNGAGTFPINSATEGAAPATQSGGSAQPVIRERIVP